MGAEHTRSADAEAHAQAETSQPNRAAGASLTRQVGETPAWTSADVLFAQRAIGNRATASVLARQPGSPHRPPWRGSWPPMIPYAEILDALEENWLKAKHGKWGELALGIRKRNTIRYWEEQIAAGERLVKVLPGPAQFPTSAKGYIGLEKHIRGKTVTQIEDALGFRRGYLGGQMVVQELIDPPQPGEFDFRGYNYMHPGTDPARPPNVPDPRFVIGEGYGQWELIKPVPVRQLAVVNRGDRYKPPVPHGGGKAPTTAAGGTSVRKGGGTTLLKPEGGGTTLLKQGWKLRLPSGSLVKAVGRHIRSAVMALLFSLVLGFFIDWVSRREWDKKVKRFEGEVAKRLEERLPAALDLAVRQPTVLLYANIVFRSKETLVLDGEVGTTLVPDLEVVRVYFDDEPLSMSGAAVEVGRGDDSKMYGDIQESWVDHAMSISLWQLLDDVPAEHVQAFRQAHAAALAERKAQRPELRAPSLVTSVPREDPRAGSGR
jgi:hypothetical protein